MKSNFGVKKVFLWRFERLWILSFGNLSNLFWLKSCKNPNSEPLNLLGSRIWKLRFHVKSILANLDFRVLKTNTSTFCKLSNMDFGNFLSVHEKLPNCPISQTSKSNTTNTTLLVVSKPYKLPKLISRKIWELEKL